MPGIKRDQGVKPGANSRDSIEALIRGYGYPDAWERLGEDIDHHVAVLRGRPDKVRLQHRVACDFKAELHPVDEDVECRLPIKVKVIEFSLGGNSIKIRSKKGKVENYRSKKGAEGAIVIKNRHGKPLTKLKTYLHEVKHYNKSGKFISCVLMVRNTRSVRRLLYSVGT